MKKAPLPPSPHPQKLRLVGRQRGRNSVVWKEKDEPLIASFISFSVGEERRECHSSIHPFEIFRGKLFQNCPAATSNTRAEDAR